MVNRNKKSSEKLRVLFYPAAYFLSDKYGSESARSYDTLQSIAKTGVTLTAVVGYYTALNAFEDWGLSLRMKKFGFKISGSIDVHILHHEEGLSSPPQGWAISPQRWNNYENLCWGGDLK